MLSWASSFWRTGFARSWRRSRPELEEMDEETRDGVMREIRAIYERGDSVLKSFMYGPLEEYL